MHSGRLSPTFLKIAYRSIQKQIEHILVAWGLPWCLSRHYTDLMACSRHLLRQIVASIAGGLWLIFGDVTPAKAEFAVCNQSFDVVNVAIGQVIKDEFQTEGWWTIGPNQCANVIKEKLVSRYVYIYAQDVFGQPIMTGTTRMCISPTKFQITGDKDCWIRGKVSVGFVEVDTKETERWTLFLAAVQ